MYPVPHQSGFQERKHPLRRLPRRHPSPSVRRKLRKLPFRERVADLIEGYSKSPESLPTCGSTCNVAVRRLPQKCSSRPVCGALNRLLQLSSAGLSDPRHQSCRGGIFDKLRNLPHHEFMVQRQVRSSEVYWVRAHRSACHAAVHVMPHEQRVQGHTGGLFLLSHDRFHQFE